MVCAGNLQSTPESTQPAGRGLGVTGPSGPVNCAKYTPNDKIVKPWEIGRHAAQVSLTCVGPVVQPAWPLPV